jgi:predicted patatin/cPLA2 family phospholipase
MDLDWLWDELSRREPLDEEAIARRRTTLISVGTCVHTGRARYLTHRPPHIHSELKAGCALPLLYRGPVKVREHALVDGGLVDPIPAAEAYRRGARRIVVIRSRPAAVVKQPSPLDGMAAFLLRRHPQLASSTRKVASRYQKAVGFIQAPPPDLQILHLAPERPLRTTRTSRDHTALRDDYALGCATARRHLERLRALLLD